MSEFKIWSCKLNQPHTLKSHRTLDAAAKRVGDYGVVYDPETNAVYQVFHMSNNTIARFNTVSQSNHCSLGGFDMRAAMNEFNIAMPVHFAIRAIMPGCEMYISSSNADVSDTIDGALKFTHGQDNPVITVNAFKQMTGLDIWEAVTIK